MRDAGNTFRHTRTMASIHPRPALIAWTAVLLGLVLPALAGSRQAYRWIDQHGAVHYADNKPQNLPDAKVRVIPIAVEPRAIARLRVEAGDGNYLAWADNHLAGPIEVMLSFTRSSNVHAEPALPARATVPAHGSVLVARLGADAPGRNGSFELSLRGVPGNPSARPQDVEYMPPLRQPRSRIEQGYDGQFSHDDEENRYALDFAADIGTPVRAARAGMVMQVESDFSKAGLKKESYSGRANFVRMLHEDGTMALYAHLKTGGVLVRVGQHVQAGQQIDLSGNTGFTTGPHLHFALQVNRGMRLLSIPFRMRGIRAPP